MLLFLTFSLWNFPREWKFHYFHVFFLMFCEYRSIRELHTAPDPPSCLVLPNFWSQLFRFIQTNAPNKSICFSCIVQFEIRLQSWPSGTTHRYNCSLMCSAHSKLLAFSFFGGLQIVILIYTNYFFTGLTLPRFCKNQRLGETSILCTKIISLLFLSALTHELWLKIYI